MYCPCPCIVMHYALAKSCSTVVAIRELNLINVMENAIIYQPIKDRRGC